MRAEEGILGNRAGTVVHEVVLGEQAAECAGGELAHVGPELEDPAKLVHKCRRVAVDRIHEVGAPEFDNRRCEDRRCAGGLPRELSGEVVGPREAGARDGRLQVFGVQGKRRVYCLAVQDVVDLDVEVQLGTGEMHRRKWYQWYQSNI